MLGYTCEGAEGERVEEAMIEDTVCTCETVAACFPSDIMEMTKAITTTRESR